MALVPCLFLEADKLLLRHRVKIAHGQVRIIVALTRKITTDVAQIFTLKRQRVVFRMALEEQEAAGILPDENVDAGLCRTRQHLVARLREVALGDLVETRMRDLERRRRGPR